MTILAYNVPRFADYSVRRPSATRPPEHASYATSIPDHVGRFRKLFTEWQRLSVTQSSVADKISMPSFLAIVAMGENAVPLIVRELRVRPSFLFMALQMITRANPVPPYAAGQPLEIARAWVAWAEEQGYDAD